MLRNFTLRAGLLAVMSMTLASCTESFGEPGQSFRKQYFAARGALEEGRYDRANQLYLRLFESAGALEPRLRLEYAHSLLRGNDFARASAEARALAARQEGKARSASLAVLGTAEHELGLAALSRGDADAGRNHLSSARDAIAAVLDKDPDLDPLGALAGRQASIAVRLKSLDAGR